MLQVRHARIGVSLYTQTNKPTNKHQLINWGVGVHVYTHNAHTLPKGMQKNRINVLAHPHITCICTLAHTHTCTHVHTHTHAHRHIQVHTHTGTYMYTRTRMYTRTHAHTCTHAHRHIHVHTRTHVHTHTGTYTHTQAHTCTHAHRHTHQCKALLNEHPHVDPTVTVGAGKLFVLKDEGHHYSIHLSR